MIDEKLLTGISMVLIAILVLMLIQIDGMDNAIRCEQNGDRASIAPFPSSYVCFEATEESLQKRIDYLEYKKQRLSKS